MASSLATSVAAQLGITPQAAQERLTQAFTQALQPNDTGPPGTNAERASTLVARLRQIAELATRVTNGDTGQPIRLIAGQRSDAVEAKATPAPQPDRILRDALAALAATASPTLDSTASAPPITITAAAATPIAAAPVTVGDGLAVALPAPVQAIATGGDTPLGRIIARAMLAGEKTATPVASPIAGPGSSHLGILPGVVPAAVESTAVATVAPALDAFVQAFASALARSDAQTGRTGGSSAAIPPAAETVPGPSGNPSSALSFAIPFVHDAVSIAPPSPAPALPQPQHVDANAVVDQILRGMAIRTTDGQSEVRLRLVPEQLGDVSIRLIVTGGSVNATITAHTADAQNALAGGQTQLAKTLADAGLKLQSFTVGLAGGAFADGRDQSRPNDSWTQPGTRRFGGVSSVAVDGSDDLALFANPGFGPPIYSARSLPGNFNILA